MGLCLLAGLSYAAYAMVNKRLVATVSPSVATASVFSCAALLALPGAWALSGAPQVQTTDVAVVLWLMAQAAMHVA